MKLPLPLPHQLLERKIRGDFDKNIRGKFFRGLEFAEPEGDPGWFGLDSVTWRLHAEFPSMLAGGLCALMLQTLHPRALAGVYDHSNFRQDLVGRLRRRGRQDDASF